MEPRIACGKVFALLVDSQGVVWASGKNDEGQLGGDKRIVQELEKIDFDVVITSVFAGVNYSVSIDENGSPWVLGSNTSGKLGLGDKTTRNIPEMIPDLPAIEKASCGENHLFLLDTGSNLWCSGSNRVGQLGIGDKSKQEIIKIEKHSIGPVFEVVCGYNHTLIITQERNVMSTGLNSLGQLGLGASSIFGKKKNRFEFTPIQHLSDVHSISCGGFHSLFLTSDGKVYGSGQNFNGQIGLGSKKMVTKPHLIDGLPKISYIGTGGSTNICLDEDGCLWTFGLDISGGGRFLKAVKFPNYSDAIGSFSVGQNNFVFFDINEKLWGCGQINSENTSGLRQLDDSFQNIFSSGALRRMKAKSARK